MAPLATRPQLQVSSINQRLGASALAMLLFVIVIAPSRVFPPVRRHLVIRSPCRSIFATAAIPLRFVGIVLVVLSSIRHKTVCAAIRSAHRAGLWSDDQFVEETRSQQPASAAVHNQTDATAETAQNAGMASIILTQRRAFGSSIFPGQREAGTLTRFDNARLPVGASGDTTMAPQTLLEREREGGGSPATRNGGNPRKATHVTHDDAPVLQGISPLTTGTMPRAEDDEATRAGSYEFHDRPGSGRHTADRLQHF